jgi:DNA-binding response OmpR family regulator
VARFALADYLRDCGFRVIEAATPAEARAVLGQTEVTVDVTLIAAEFDGRTAGFALAQWVRSTRPSTQIILAGTVDRAAHDAGELCAEGPQMRRPYDPQQVVERIKVLRNLPR